MKAALRNLGCKVNAYETESMMRQLEEAGYEIVAFNCKADVYIVNTCSVTNIADRKSRQMLHRPKKMNKDAVVVATGCYVQAIGEELLKDEKVDIIIGNNQKNKIVSLIDEYIKNNSINKALVDISKENEYEETFINGNEENVRVNIKVQDGCNQFCTYCIIPYTRGRVRSRKVSDVVAETERIAGLGYKEIVITGINLSSYGSDFVNEKVSLIEMVEKLCKIEGIERIRLGSLEPRVIDEKFLKVISENKKICKHFHLSMQSGCNATLKRMNRHYTIEEYFSKCRIIREKFDDPAITTDVIVGFPGETEEEFNQTYDFIEQIAFSNIHVFKYSKRNGTKAAMYPEQVDDDIKHLRSERLINLNKIMFDNYRKKYIGKVVKVLFEEKVKIAEKEYYIGLTEDYVKVAICSKCIKEYIENNENAKISEENITNKIIPVSVKSMLNKEILLAEF